MGWKSTSIITREEAIRMINYAMADLENLSDEELCDLLEQVLGGENHGSNYQIGNDTTSNP